MSSVFNVAQYILNRVGAMSAMKLQKLCYYCQAWSLAWDGVPLFPEEFQAWANGPVCPDLFRRHKGIFQIPKDFFNNAPEYAFSVDEIETMDSVLNTYGDKSPLWLSELSHSERPWKQARIGVAPGEPCTRKIDKDIMQEFYGGLGHYAEES